jgi:hypothetical protein
MPEIGAAVPLDAFHAGLDLSQPLADANEA